MAAHYILNKSTNSQFFFNLTAENSEKILTSETYVSKSGALNGIESCRENSQIDERYFKYTSTNGQYYFLLKAGNNETIGRSEMYSSQSARDNGIAAVKRVGKTATLDDRTLGLWG